MAVTALLLASSLAAETPLACNMSALTREQKARHQQLSGVLKKAVTGRQDLPNGYALTLKRDIPLRDLAEWISLESRCCPFLDFSVDVESKGVVRLKLTGGVGAKDFLAAELSELTR